MKLQSGDPIWYQYTSVSEKRPCAFLEYFTKTDTVYAVIRTAEDLELFVPEDSVWLRYDFPSELQLLPSGEVFYGERKIGSIQRTGYKQFIVSWLHNNRIDDIGTIETEDGGLWLLWQAYQKTSLSCGAERPLLTREFPEEVGI